MASYIERLSIFQVVLGDDVASLNEQDIPSHNGNFDFGINY